MSEATVTDIAREDYGSHLLCLFCLRLYVPVNNVSVGAASWAKPVLSSFAQGPHLLYNTMYILTSARLWMFTGLK